MRSKPPFSLLRHVTNCILYAILLWLGSVCGYLFAVYVGTGGVVRPGGPSSPPATSGGGGGGPSLRAAPAVRALPSSSNSSASLLASLRAASARLAPLPGERIPLVHYTLALTGDPPLVSHSDVSADGQPDFHHFGVPALMPRPAFFVADPHDGAPDDALPRHVESPLRYVARSEDAVRDIVLAMLASPGRLREGTGMGAKALLSGGGGESGGGGNGSDGKKRGGARVTCKASPVTIPYACLASLRMERPALFEEARGGDALTRPLPASAGGPLVVDVGFTSGGYYGLLAASQGVSALVVDSQPQCAMYAALGAAASGFSDRVTVFPAVPLPRDAVGDKAALPAPLRTGCVSTSTTNEHPSAADIAEYYTGKGRVPPPASAEGKDDDGGRAAAGSARKRVGTEGDAFAGGGGGSVDLPVAALDDILCAQYGASCEGGVATGAPSPPTLLLLKIDARGREMDVLSGLTRTLASPESAPLNVLVEVNKQHAAAALGLASPRKAAKDAGLKFPIGIPLAEGVVAGFGLSSVKLTDQENEAVAEQYVALVQLLLEAGYEVLVSDRGWWAAQDPWRQENLDRFKPLSDGTTLTSWSSLLSRRNEVDIWAYKGSEKKRAAEKTSIK